MGDFWWEELTSDSSLLQTSFSQQGVAAINQDASTWTDTPAAKLLRLQQASAAMLPSTVDALQKVQFFPSLDPCHTWTLCASYCSSPWGSEHRRPSFHFEDSQGMFKPFKLLAGESSRHSHRCR